MLTMVSRPTPVCSGAFSKGQWGSGIARYAEVGVEGQDPQARHSADCSANCAARVVALTCTAPPHQATHWTGRAMAKAVAISLRSVQRVWQAHQLQPYRIRAFKRSRDPSFTAKLAMLSSYRSIHRLMPWCSRSTKRAISKRSTAPNRDCRSKRCMQPPMAVPSSTLNAAIRVAVPCRLESWVESQRIHPLSQRRQAQSRRR